MSLQIDLDWRAPSEFETTDIFGVTFDFINDTMQIYVNNNKADIISLKGNKSIIVGFSLDIKGDVLEILEYELQ